MYRERPQSVERGWGEAWGAERCHCVPTKPGSPWQAPCSSLLRHSSVAVAAERLAGMSSSVPCRCRVKLVSWPGDMRDRGQPGEGHGAGSSRRVSCPRPCAGQGDPQTPERLWPGRRTQQIAHPWGGKKHDQAQGDPSKNGVPSPRGTHLCCGHHPCSPAGGSRSPWGSHPRSVWT